MNNDDKVFDKALYRKVFKIYYKGLHTLCQCLAMNFGEMQNII